MEWFVQQRQVSEKVEFECHVVLLPFMSFCQKRNQESFKPLPRQSCLGTENATVQKNAALFTGSL